MFLELSKKIAKKSTHHQHSHASFVVVGGSIQSMGYNCGTTHAEEKALKQLWPNKRAGVTVYSFRWRKDGSLGMAKPCPKCETFMRDAGVKKVYYSDNNGVVHMMKL